MNRKIIVMISASDGIGAEAARQFHAKGATVVIVGRSPEKTKAVADELHAPSSIADFSKLSDVRTLADELRRDLPRIDVLAKNAGGIFGTRELTVDGHEKTMQVNHLAPFLLTNVLLDRLIASKASGCPGESVGSIGGEMGRAGVRCPGSIGERSGSPAYRAADGIVQAITSLILLLQPMHH